MISSLKVGKKNPMCVTDSKVPVAVLNHNKPVFYCVPREVWEVVMESLGDKREAVLKQGLGDMGIEEFKD